MENKYQEALDRLENITKVPSMFINEVVKELVETLQELVDIYPEYLELKERVTPKKPIIIYDDYWVKGIIQKRYDCPTCGGLLFDGACCPDNGCRQAIDWSENNG